MKILRLHEKKLKEFYNKSSKYTKIQQTLNDIFVYYVDNPQTAKSYFNHMNKLLLELKLAKCNDFDNIKKFRYFRSRINAQALKCNETHYKYYAQAHDSFAYLLETYIGALFDLKMQPIGIDIITLSRQLTIALERNPKFNWLKFLKRL